MANLRMVDGCPDKMSATTNFLYVNDVDRLAGYEFVETSGYVFKISAHPAVANGSVAVNAVQRKILRVAARDTLDLQPWKGTGSAPPASMISAEVSSITDKASLRQVELSAEPLVARLIKCFQSQVMTVGQLIAFDHEGSNYKLSINELLADADGKKQPVQRAVIGPKTAFMFERVSPNAIEVSGQSGFIPLEFSSLNFEQLGIGGLDKQFEDIFRRAFASRIYPPSFLQKIGQKHVRGILLYGPPGTGKTLIARQIGKVFNRKKEPKIVNGPEILNKYVGESENNIRELFKEAEEDQKTKGDASELHIIIFDEIDAICKQRGSVRDGSGVHDTVVNQLLTKVDGVNALNNILLIGMTNRKDMLDEALLRPGRLEVMIEIGLPDKHGRLQILKIHTNKMSENSFLARDVDLVHLSEVTKNFSGAELEGLVRAATSRAIYKPLDMNNLNQAIDEDAIKVTMADFEHAMEEVRPAFGAATDTLELYRLHGIISCGDAFDHIMRSLRLQVRQVQESEKTPLLSCVLEGPVGSGKSAMAATVALEGDFPFVKIISPETLVGFNEQAKCSQITRVFEDAYRSPLSMIILDDIERLLEYVAIGPRFSNAVLQTLLVLIKRNPPPGKKLYLIGTSSASEVIESMGLSDVFNCSLHVPALRVDEIVRVVRSLDVFNLHEIPDVVDMLATHVSKTIPIKRLLYLIESAKQDVEKGTKIPLARWQETLRDWS